MIGKACHREAAVRIADTLASKVVAGDAENSPWPFRIRAQDGGERRGVSWRSTSNWTGTLRLFDARIADGATKAAAYSRARDLTMPGASS